MSKVVVLSAKHYRFPDRETSEIKEGVTVHYVDPRTANMNGVKGTEPLKVSLPPEKLPFFNSGSGIYEIEYAHVPKKGRMELVPVDFNFVESIDLLTLVGSR